MKAEILHAIFIFGDKVLCLADEMFVRTSCLPGLLQYAIGKLRDHGDTSGHKISEIVCKVPVDSVDYGLPGKISIETERDLPEEKKPELVYPIGRGYLGRGDDIAQGL